MAQKTSFNINPYFDDFDSQKNFYKVLFNPGRPIQSRELNTIQSILQNQIESFGNHIFKEGSRVIPGGVHYDGYYHAVKLNPLAFGIDISQYIEKYVGKKIRGQISGLTAVVKKVVLPNSQISDITLYVKYLDSDATFSGGKFIDGETLLSTEPISYGINNVVISDGSPFASLISSEATAVGSAVSIDNGIYFIRGNFVAVSKDTLILEYYSQYPSYRVGLNVSEEIITAKDDKTLYDNAKGFNNFSSPGADRFKINLTLTKKSLTDFNDTSFVELLRVDTGVLKKQVVESDYNLIKDYIAKRTYEESGNYTVEPFNISLNNSLNDSLGNNGKYFEGVRTSNDNLPSDDLMCVTLGPGKGYVKGYDIQKVSTTVIDVEKPRDTQTIDDILVPFDTGNILRVNNVFGCVKSKETVEFYNRRRDSTNENTNGDGEKIGEASVYLFKLTNAPYKDESTTWDLHLYNMNLYTELTLGTTLSSTEIKTSSRVVGQASGAIGYSISDGNNTNIIKVEVESGSFIQNEVIHIDGIEKNKRSIKSLRIFTSKDIKSVYRDDTPDFHGDVVLDTEIAPGYNSNDDITITRVDDSSATLTSFKGFSGITTNTIVRYTIPGDNVETFNRVSAVGATNVTLVGVTTITNVNNGSVIESGDPTVENVSFKIGTSSIKDPEKAYLYSILPHRTISTIDLDGSQLTFSSSYTTNATNVTSNELTLNTSNFILPGNSGSIKFDTFSPEKYSIHYDDGTIQALTQDQVVFTNNYTTVTFANINNGAILTVLASFIKSGIQSKAKIYKKSEILDINLSKYNQSGTNEYSSIDDGLSYNRFYGLRVQDEEICLKYPDVAQIIAVYEAIESDVVFDTINFSSLYAIGNNVVIGEDFIGETTKSVARVISKSTNSVGIVYLNSEKLQVGENVKFRSTNINGVIESITPGSYKDRTSSFTLDKGQKDEYYDYSRLIRKKDQSEPSKKLKIVYDRYHVDGTDNGDLYSVSSYAADSYHIIPRIGRYGIRASDLLDFRPRVSYFSAVDKSPFSSNGRDFGTSPKVIITPNEASLISYDIYLPRTDKIYLDSDGSFTVEKGISSLEPKQSKKSTDGALELGSILLPAYLFDTSHAYINIIDNRRYTMRDIGAIENRVENLEEVTSLSLLELSTQTIQIKDADGLDRFKTGFFADSFKNSSLISKSFSYSQIDNDVSELVPLKTIDTVPFKILTETPVPDNEWDSAKNYTLLDNRIKKSGRVITLDYKEDNWIEQPFTTRIENVNPFHVIQYVGDIQLNPFRDIWTRTHQLEDRTIRHSLNLNLESQIETDRFNLTQQGNGIRPGNHGLGQNEFRDTFLNLNLDTTTGTTRTHTSSDSDSAQDTQQVFVDNVLDEYMRHRNTEFSASNLKAFTQYYAFLDGFSNVDIVPKLIEVAKDKSLQTSGINKVFEVGEEVDVFDGSKRIMGFRVAAANHKSGPYDQPNLTYDVNPYNKDESFPAGYSQSSTILNVDTLSLSENAGDEYDGYIKEGALIQGKTSGATAYVKDIRLITDNYGDIIGTFYIRDPNSSPPPPVRVSTGSKTFRLSSSKDDSPGILGNTDISSAEANYVSEGTVKQFQRTTRVTEITAELVTTNNIRTRTLTATRGEMVSTIETPEPIINNITNIDQRDFSTTVINNITNIQHVQQRNDPLAQTFLVGTARGLNSFNDDESGAFLTAVDLFFNTVDSGNAEITIQVRTTEFGIPTLVVIGDPVTLRPTDIVDTSDADGNKTATTKTLRENVSDDGSVATRVTFPYPIALPPSQEYAIVLMSPESDEYQVFTARMGEDTLNTKELPDVENVRYTKQFAIGSLFKSQNGSTWTPDQYEDLKFKLYKSNFTSTKGVAYLGNVNLTEENNLERKLNNNPISILPRKLKVGIDTTSADNLITDLVEGRKIVDNSNDSIYGYIEKVGSKATTVGIDTGGRNYPNLTSISVETYNLTGHGSGLKLDVSTTNGVITSASPTTGNQGSGYVIGDIVGIKTSDTTNKSGEESIITITSNNDTIDTLYLANVAGSTFSNNDLNYYNNSGTKVALADTNITSSGTYLSDYYDGTYMKVDHFDHGMYSGTNIVRFSDILPDTPEIKITASLIKDATDLSISASDMSKFDTFEGVDVSSSNKGYLLINGRELVKYESASGTSISSLTRGFGGTVATEHSKDSTIQKYEMGGVSLRRLNKKHHIVDTDIDMDSYYVKIENNSTDYLTNIIGEDRSSDSVSSPTLSFNGEKSVGGNKIYATENIVYDTVAPLASYISLSPSVNATAQIRTVSSTSVKGSEISFTDIPYQDIELNRRNKMSSLRMVSSSPNADEYLTSLPEKRSSILALTFSTNNYNLSPMMFLDDITAEYSKHRIDKPDIDYVNDKRTSTFLFDPHKSTYVSKTVRLAQSSNTLKVMLSAFRDKAADFRVMYSLVKVEGNPSIQTFEMFPGYQNLTIDADTDGYLDIIDVSKNSGLPDKFTPSSSSDNQFIQYEYTAPNVGPFIGFAIKIVMTSSKMDKYPRFKDLRAIALA